MPERMDVISRLNVFRSICQSKWRTPAEVGHTRRGVPYLQVGSRVRVVLFPGKHLVRLYFVMPTMYDQTVLTYEMDHGSGGKWMSDEFIVKICLFAAAINHHLLTDTFSQEAEYEDA